MRSCFQVDEQSKWFFEKESLDSTMKTVEMTNKGLEYYIKLVDKIAAGSERTDSYFK